MREGVLIHPLAPALGSPGCLDTGCMPLFPSVWLAWAFSLRGDSPSSSHTVAGISKRTGFPQRYKGAVVHA